MVLLLCSQYSTGHFTPVIFPNPHTIRWITTVPTDKLVQAFGLNAYNQLSVTKKIYPALAEIIKCVLSNLDMITSRNLKHS